MNIPLNCSGVETQSGKKGYKHKLRYKYSGWVNVFYTTNGMDQYMFKWNRRGKQKEIIGTNN